MKALNHRRICGSLALVAGMLFCNLLWGSNQAGTAAQRKSSGRNEGGNPKDVSSLFRKVQSDLLGKTSVPLRLPTYVPDAGDKENPLYTNLIEANAESYRIELGWVEGCLGGNACHYGAISGGTKAPEEDGAKIPVALRGGVKGYFVDFACGAHCGDAVVGWSENGYHYSIALKAGKKQELIKMANSALAAGPGR